ncbi:MAG: HEAT repeat domain-containing protein [Planctomycetes bacterium]|nr:HEAT repeat domain-containing protein [Planctomycetota bacterium]
MTKLLLHLALAIAAQTGDKDAPRERNPLAPSLTLPTKEESERYEKVINRFIQFDIGQLKGGEGKKAYDEFKRLPAEAIFELIEGFNRAANLEHSCPAVVIGQKILRILNSSDDLELLMSAKESVGSGVTGKRHKGMLHEVQTGILLRKGALQRQALAGGGGPTGESNLTDRNFAGKLLIGPRDKSLGALPLAELLKRSETEKGEQLKRILTELEKRDGPKVFETLAIATKHENGDIQKFSQTLLAKHVSRENPTQLKDLLKHEEPAVRLAAAREAGAKKIRHVSELIDLINDAEPAVQKAAHQSLVQVTGVDHGPSDDASFGDRQTAQRQWREWWEKQGKR